MQCIRWDNKWGINQHALDRSKRTVHAEVRTNIILCCVSHKIKISSSRTGYQVFALQAGGWCASSSTALETYKKYGPSSNCASDGEGGGWANQVYLIKFDGKHFLCSVPTFYYLIDHKNFDAHPSIF